MNVEMKCSPNILQLPCDCDNSNVILTISHKKMDKVALINRLL